MAQKSRVSSWLRLKESPLLCLLLPISLFGKTWYFSFLEAFFFAKWQISFLFCGAVGNKYLKWGDGHWWCIYRFSETPFCRECAATKMLHLPVLQKIYTAGGWTYCKVNKIKKYKRGAKLCAWEAKITFLSRQTHAL